MPKPVIRIQFVEDGGISVKSRFKAYGGNDKDWAWIVRELNAMNPRTLERRFEKLQLNPPCRRLAHGPCVVWGDLKLTEPTLWEAGVIDGIMEIEAIVHRKYERLYYEEVRSGIPPKDQAL